MHRLINGVYLQSRRDWLLYVVKTIGSPLSFETIILLLVTKSHTQNTSPRDVKPAPLIEQYDSVCDMGTPFQPVDPTHPKVPGLNWCLAASGIPPPIVTEMLQDWTNTHATPLW